MLVNQLMQQEKEALLGSLITHGNFPSIYLYVQSCMLLSSLIAIVTFFFKEVISHLLFYFDGHVLPFHIFLYFFYFKLSLILSSFSHSIKYANLSLSLMQSVQL